MSSSHFQEVFDSITEERRNYLAAMDAYIDKVKRIQNLSKYCPLCGSESFGALMVKETYGLFTSKQKHYLAYSCDKCGTRWESELW